VGLEIGNTKLDIGLFLAPMAGYTDRAMRMVAHEAGAEWSVTEMVSAKAVVFGDKKTFNLARIRGDEGNVSLQIFGSEPDVMAKAASVLERGYTEDGYVPPLAIDINMGCPVNKVFGNGDGSALMRDPELIYKIVKSVSENTAIPTTVKLRAGIDSSSINAVECALAAEAGGASLVAVHGRTRSQLYGGRADRNIIRDVKKALHIPVIANGDITDGQSALDMLSDTGADGIMIGRGAVGNPYLFAQIRAALEGKMFCVPTLEEKRKTALLQLRLAIEDKGETVAVNEARKQIAIYFKGFRGSATLRAKINAATTYAEVEAALEEVK
jgi:nifR3 family TIM-barrel protein